MLQNAFLESILQHDLNLNATLKLTSSSKTDSQGLVISCHSFILFVHMLQFPFLGLAMFFKFNVK